jgi:hypothetical protein
VRVSLFDLDLDIATALEDAVGRLTRLAQAGSWRISVLVVWLLYIMLSGLGLDMGEWRSSVLKVSKLFLFGLLVFIGCI